MNSSTRVGPQCNLGDETGRQDERATQERDRDDGHDKDPGGADRAPEDLRPEVRQPGAVLVAALAVEEGGSEDPLVQVRRRGRRGEAAQEGQEPRRPAELCGAGRAALDVSRQAGGVGPGELVHEERVDETARLGVLEGLATDRRVVHILYMAGRAAKVAAGVWRGRWPGRHRQPPSVFDRDPQHSAGRKASEWNRASVGRESREDLVRRDLADRSGDPVEAGARDRNDGRRGVDTRNP